MRKKHLIVVAVLMAAFIFTSCQENSRWPRVYSNMEGATADCEFSVITIKFPDGTEVPVDINGMPVEEFQGAELICQPCTCPANWQVVSRRGVRLSRVFDAAGVNVTDVTPVNFVPRDGWDILRTMLGSDTGKLPTFSFYNSNGYVYVGSPGVKDPAYPEEDPKDPLYPEMEGRSLCIDYDFGDVEEAQSEAASMGIDMTSSGCFGGFRYKMMEKYDDEYYGIIEIDPQVD